MAWTEQCKIDFHNQVEHKKENGLSAKAAIRELSKESGIPKSTLDNWYWPSKESSPKNGATKTTQKQKHDNSYIVSDLQELVDCGKKFSTIYADPPWQYSNQATRSATDTQYDTMPFHEIEALPIPILTEENAHIHLWTTNAFIFDARVLLESWGFEYKSIFVWVKPQMGIGNYWRVSHEFMLFGIRGRLPFADRGVMSWLEHRRTRHSAKPEEVAKLIERVSPPEYLELFGRRTRPGWTVWGNEIEKTLFNQESF